MSPPNQVTSADPEDEDVNPWANAINSIRKMESGKIGRDKNAKLLKQFFTFQENEKNENNPIEYDGFTPSGPIPYFAAYTSSHEDDVEFKEKEVVFSQMILDHEILNQIIKSDLQHLSMRQREQRMGEEEEEDEEKVKPIPLSAYLENKKSENKDEEDVSDSLESKREIREEKGEEEEMNPLRILDFVFALILIHPFHLIASSSSSSDSPTNEEEPVGNKRKKKKKRKLRSNDLNNTKNESRINDLRERSQFSPYYSPLSSAKASLMSSVLLPKFIQLLIEEARGWKKVTRGRKKAGDLTFIKQVPHPFLNSLQQGISRILACKELEKGFLINELVRVWCEATKPSSGKPHVDNQEEEEEEEEEELARPRKKKRVSYSYSYSSSESVDRVIKFKCLRLIFPLTFEIMNQIFDALRMRILPSSDQLSFQDQMNDEFSSLQSCISTFLEDKQSKKWKEYDFYQILFVELNFEVVVDPIKFVVHLYCHFIFFIFRSLIIQFSESEIQRQQSSSFSSSSSSSSSFGIKQESDKSKWISIWSELFNC